MSSENDFTNQKSAPSFEQDSSIGLEVLSQGVQIPIGSVYLEGNLSIPQGVKGIILFAHGSGSSRHSPRNQYVASILQKAKFATLLVDLLTLEEEKAEEYTGHLRFDIELLANRLLKTTRWLKENPKTKSLALGYFGASTGAGAALVAAAKAPQYIKALVSRGGRPDLAEGYLAHVQTPTLLIVGGHDAPVIQVNEAALHQLQTIKNMIIVPGATHLFEESGALQAVAQHATEWFSHYLNPIASTSTR